MKCENGLWHYHGKIYATFHDALRVAWDKKLDVRNDNLLAVYRLCSGFYYNSMDMPGGGSDVQEVEGPMRLIDADKLRGRVCEIFLCAEPNSAEERRFAIVLGLIDSEQTITLPPNDPLTLEQLREMDGEPVWLHTFSAVQKKTQISQWAILECSSNANAIFLRAGVNSRLTKWFCNYGTRWLAYRRRPEDANLD